MVRELKPMLAGSQDKAEFETFPYLASPKLDGIRGLVRDGVVLSRSLKPIPNLLVQSLFGRANYEGFDGELCVGPANAKDLMSKTQKGVMAVNGEPDVNFHVFDLWNEPTLSYESRFRLLGQKVADIDVGTFKGSHRVRLVPHNVINSKTEMAKFELAMLNAGFEGIMVRLPAGPYKMGRSTWREGYLIKVKRFEDAEAVCIGVEEMMHNDNEKTEDNLGHAKRATNRENMRPAGTLGALVCQRPSDGQVFKVGTGLTAELKKELWAQHELGELVGKLVKYKHFAITGVKDAPRIPVFIGLRDPRDT